MPRRPVRSFLARDTVLKAEPEKSVRDAAIGMAANHCGSVLVARGDALLGIFTERDLLARVVAAGRDLDTQLLEVMTANPDTIAADAPVGDAIRQMSEGGYRHLPVIEDDRVVGVLSIRDLPFAEIAVVEKEMDDRQSLTERIW